MLPCSCNNMDLHQYKDLWLCLTRHDLIAQRTVSHYSFNIFPLYEHMEWNRYDYVWYKCMNIHWNEFSYTTMTSSYWHSYAVGVYDGVWWCSSGVYMNCVYIAHVSTFDGCCKCMMFLCLFLCRFVWIKTVNIGSLWSHCMLEKFKWISCDRRNLANGCRICDRCLGSKKYAGQNYKLRLRRKIYHSQIRMKKYLATSDPVQNKYDLWLAVNG